MSTQASEHAVATSPKALKKSAKPTPAAKSKQLVVTLRRLARDFDGGKAKKGTIALILDPTKFGTGPEGWLNRRTYANREEAVAAASKAEAKVAL